MKAFFLLIMLAVFVSPVLPQDNSKPFVLKLSEKPSVLKIGRKHKFVFAVQNTTRKPLTLSSVCAASAVLAWGKGGETQESIAPSCELFRIVHGTALDAATKQIKYFTETVPAGAAREDFFTLAANESKSFEVELAVPKAVKAKFVTVRLGFESRYDGKAAGIEAWSGTPSYIDIRMVLVK
jgi:hypothetical protein